MKIEDLAIGALLFLGLRGMGGAVVGRQEPFSKEALLRLCARYAHTFGNIPPEAIYATVLVENGFERTEMGEYVPRHPTGEYGPMGIAMVRADTILRAYGPFISGNDGRTPEELLSDWQTNVEMGAAILSRGVTELGLQLAPVGVAANLQQWDLLRMWYVAPARARQGAPGADIGGVPWATRFARWHRALEVASGETYG